MTCRISYNYEPVGSQIGEGVQRTEYFRTEFEALKRARKLLKDGKCGIAVADSSGRVLTGVQLELKLGIELAAQTTTHSR
jgi:hypothetical protein